MILKYSLLCLSYLLLYVQSQQVVVNSGTQLTPEEIAEIERSYEDFVKKNRVRNTDSSRSSGRKTQAQGNSQPSREDVQNDRSLSRISLITLGTVNFNNIIPGVERGDVFPSPNDREYRTTTVSVSTIRSSRRTKRKAINTLYNVVEKWDNAKLHYRVESSSFSDANALRTKIRSSLAPIEQNSCVTFEEVLETQIWPSGQSLVEVVDSGSCASVIGRVPNTAQRMSLAPGCHVTGTIQHEFLHALGFGHEHERPDRDGFVAINSKYIQEEYIHNFFKEPYPTYSTDIAYDLSSIMHYSQNQFSIDLSANTIELRDPYLAISALDIGQRIGISWLDEVAVNKYYDCKKDCQISCANGGYVRKLTSGVCTCVCPPGLAGSTCEEVVRPCGRYVDLTSVRQQVVTSQGFNGQTDNVQNDVCYFFIKGPGYLELTFSHFDVKCDNNLEIRSFHISQPALGLCGSTEPAPVRTIFSPNPGMMMLVYDTTQSVSGERGWSLTATSHTDACLQDPCHGAPCTPTPGSDVLYTCSFPDHAMHCDFEEGLLGACDRVIFNKYYQQPGDFQMAWQVASNNNPHMFTSTDITSLPQRGIASITPHDFTGLMFILQLVFETLYTDEGAGIDTVDIDNLHLIPQPCPPVGDACASFSCGDRDCVSMNGAAVCSYPDTDIHCGFEAAENGCKADIEYFGNLNRNDNADWTSYSGATLTPGTGPDEAAVGNGYIYTESNFPPSPGVPAVRTAYLRLSPRRSGNRCLSFQYHMFGPAVVRLEVRVAIYDSFVPGVVRLWERNGQQGNEWKSAQVDVNINDRLPNVKLQVEIIAKGGSKFSDIALDDIHLTKGACNRDPVNGVWGNWEAFSDCSVTCGEGTMTRSRTCTPPRNGGADCTGDATEVTACQISECSVDGRLTDWTTWGSCSATCEGMQTRTRECIPPQGAGQPCPAGELAQEQQCGVGICSIDGIWEDWSSWSTCSKTCGRGERVRSRTCIPPQHNGLPCSGGSREVTSCNTNLCPTDGVLGEWGEWNDCSQTCGTGQRIRSRPCITEAQNGGTTCAEQGLTSSEECNTNACPVDAVLSNWSDWSLCTGLCGATTQTRERTCEQEAQHGGKPCEEFTLVESQACETVDCTVDGRLSDWTDWSDCSVTCGDGQQERTRTCVPPQNGGEPCPSEPLSESQPCTVTGSCVEDIFSSWTDWSDCSVTCGRGERTRSRTCTPVTSSAECDGTVLLQTISCTGGSACPVDGVWEDWSSWSCSVTCGSGTKSRQRECIGPINGGMDCSGLSQETADCQAETENCPIDAIEGNWQSWSGCSASCGAGSRTRIRSCTPPQFGGRSCGELEESAPCFMTCEIDGIPLQWSHWSSCSVTCGRGVHSRSRTCTAPQFGGSPCNVPLTEVKSCFGVLASCERTYNEWENWGDCSQSCGLGGKSVRKRTCTGRALCDGVDITEERSCNEDVTCPVDGFYNPWEDWSSCSVTCGTGSSRRTRVCTPPIAGGNPCVGPTFQEKDCVVDCPVDGTWGEWGDWSQCSVSCYTGTSTRSRICIQPTNGGANCAGFSSEVTSCVNPPCETNDGFSPWSEWSSCSTSTCSSSNPRATQFRTRRCVITSCSFEPTFEIRQCVPDCNGGGGTIAQTTTSATTTSQGRIDGGWGEWTEWTDCPATCQGLKTRNRICNSPAPSFGGAQCAGSSSASLDCSNDPQCNALVSRPLVCEGFEHSRNIDTYGQAKVFREAFSIQSGPSLGYLANSQRFGQTGPSWAVEGRNYLLLSTNRRSRKDFVFDTEFNFTDGGCMRFKYNTHGSAWRDASLQMGLYNAANGRHSQAMWEETTSNQQHWQTARFSIPPQQFLFSMAKAVLTIQGGGQFSDFGFDDFQIGSKTCEHHSNNICSAQDLPTRRSCGFEDGDDCSWVDRDVQGTNNLWKVWRGAQPNTNSGPTSAASGSNYIFAAGAPKTLILKSLTVGRGCLEFSLFMVRSRRSGQLLVKTALNNRVAFSQFRNKQAIWRTHRVTIDIPPSAGGPQFNKTFKVQSLRLIDRKCSVLTPPKNPY
ncbi:uncharacterized protein [Watersipora subatra]|uniref:uncharacterized protein n=1 Tax=Watersipora subatra TaxID=2589382 RepID=UPI00355C34B9